MIIQLLHKVLFTVSALKKLRNEGALRSKLEAVQILYEFTIIRLRASFSVNNKDIGNQFYRRRVVFSIFPIYLPSNKGRFSSRFSCFRPSNKETLVVRGDLFTRCCLSSVFCHSGVLEGSCVQTTQLPQLKVLNALFVILFRRTDQLALSVPSKICFMLGFNQTGCFKLEIF